MNFARHFTASALPACPSARRVPARARVLAPWGPRGVGPPSVRWSRLPRTRRRGCRCPPGASGRSRRPGRSWLAPSRRCWRFGVVPGRAGRPVVLPSARLAPGRRRVPRGPASSRPRRRVVRRWPRSAPRLAGPACLGPAAGRGRVAVAAAFRRLSAGPAAGLPLPCASPPTWRPRSRRSAARAAVLAAPCAARSAGPRGRHNHAPETCPQRLDTATTAMLPGPAAPLIPYSDG